MVDYVDLMAKVGVQSCVTHNCPQCAQPAKCDLMNGASMCWCFNVKSQATTLLNYDVCLCKKCLTAHTT